MNKFVTPEELAEQLKVEVGEILSLIDQGKLRALRIGDHIRIQEEDVDRLQETCAAVPRVDQSPPLGDNRVFPDGSRWVFTRTRRAKFRVSGSISSADGVRIWPGKMRYPIHFPSQFLDRMLEQFSNREVPVGGQFDDPGAGSLGDYIQRELPTKMNPAVYLAALLIEEGYAGDGGRGKICFRPR